jgi:hypothetical protein
MTWLATSSSIRHLDVEEHHHDAGDPMALEHVEQ